MKFTLFVQGTIEAFKKVFVVAVHISVAFGVSHVLAGMAQNPELREYWPLINLLQVAVVKGIEYYNNHKGDFTLPE